jgi:hypothetical protein
MFAGTVRTGGVVSRTVMLKLLVRLWPARSVAEHATVVVPSGNVEPDAGKQVTGSVPSKASAAEAAKVTTAPLPDVASAIVGPGTVTINATPVPVKEMANWLLAADEPPVPSVM